MTSDVLSEIDAQVEKLLNTRAVFPYMRDDMIGANSCATAPFYRQYGLDIHFKFEKPLTADDIQRINEIGYWVNQNYVVRLCALLESYHVISKNERIRKDLPGHQEVDILRRLRNVFAHASGWYHNTDADQSRLRDTIIRHFSLKKANHPESSRMFPIPIDEVLIPLTKGCKRYAEAWLNPGGNAT